MNKKAIKQSLFRFVTLRNPQLIEEKDKNQGFVYHPDETKSSFYEASNANEAEKQAALRGVSSTFSALKNRKEVKDATKDLYQFSSWLMRNKKALSYAEIKSNSEDAEVLTDEQELMVWDNLIYQTIEKKSVYAREALIQVLITNKFLKAFLKFSEGLVENILFTEDQEKEFIRRACASVVMSKGLFSVIPTKPNEQSRKTNPFVAKQLEDFTEASVAKAEIEKLKVLSEALKPVEASNVRTIKASYDKALDTHNEEAERLIKETEPVIVEETDPKTGEVTRKEMYPEIKLPKFEYKAPSPIYNTNMKAKLSTNNYKTFEKAGFDMYSTFKEVYSAINEKIKDLNSVVFSKTENPEKKIRVGGTTISNRMPTQNMANYIIYVIGDSVTSDAVLTFDFIGNDHTPVSINCNTTLSNGTVLNTSDLEVVNSNGSFISIRLLDDAVLTGNSTARFVGTITFDSGITYGFDSTVSLRFGKVRGVFSIEDTDPNDNPNDNPTDNPVASQIFGVTNLGIADFRRVEQDVCCYVPGEVSHIENILAREYKERSTRSLTSVEITSETTTEKEVENLTDTTTTERNEMQSEVSSVLNEDQSQNYGASAYVKGSYGKSLEFGVDAHADFSSSSSSSNSNSQAQTYAQEVTERAMERIVQKVSSKRTSRILKEFEENNKHGFDNTKGDKHVTGVYRWVDKIYKNTLINYGKRLMYEFAIPEPARFLKDALIKKADEGQLDSEVILPTAPETPSSIGLSSAASINEGTYQNLASKYGAQVNAPIDQYIKIGKAFSKDDQSYNANGYAFNEVEVPEGYYATYGTVQWSVILDRSKPNRYLSVALGDARQTVVGRNGSSSFYNFSDIYKNNIPFSFNSYYIYSGHFNVTVNCQRSNEAYKQWQNETYNAIMDAYNERLSEYNEAMVANQVIPTGAEENLKFNPLFNRSLEKKELKRIAIELLIDQNRVSKNNYNSGNPPSVISNEVFKTHASTVKFFEQAFDWDIMAYVLYPYFYAKQEDWKELFQEQDAADPLFQAFLQSGMARTVVPVRPGFEDAVNWYMSTGEIWNGQGLVTDQDDDLYISVAEEMQTIKGEVEGTWETRVPTALTIVQGKSAFLDDEGLPCFCEDEALDNPIKPSTDLIGDSSGVGTDVVGDTDVTGNNGGSGD